MNYEDSTLIQHPDGVQEWVDSESRLHRIYGPAIIYPDTGLERWFYHGLLHRVDGPAYILPDGTQEWWQNNERHREDGPSIINPDGSQIWYLNGKLHREDGPAVIDADGYRAWFINGNAISEKDIDDWRYEYNISFDYNNWTDREKMLFKLKFLC